MECREAIYYRLCSLPVSDLSQLVARRKSIGISCFTRAKHYLNTHRKIEAFWTGILSRELIRDYVKLPSNLQDGEQQTLSNLESINMLNIFANS